MEPNKFCAINKIMYLIDRQRSYLFQLYKYLFTELIIIIIMIDLAVIILQLFYYIFETLKKYKI